MVTSEIKKLENSEIEVKVSVSWDEWEKFIAKAVKIYSEQIKIEGFRAGKAPRDMVEKKVGKVAILDEAAQLAIRDTYAQIIEKDKLQAIGSPKAEITKLAEGNPLEYTIKTAVIPEGKIAAWRDAIKKVNKEYAKKKAEVTEEEITKELEQLANSRVKLTPVEREAKNEDTVMLDFQVLQGGVPIEKGTSKNHPLTLGKGVFIPGFEENVVGMKAGEEKEFELQFPEQYHEKSLAGKPATFKVKVNEVQERQTPEVNDEFAKSLGKFENLAALKESVSKGLQEEKEHQLKEQRRGAYVDALVEKLEVTLPEVLVHEELHRMFGEFDMQLQGMGMSLDAYFSQMNKKMEEVEKEWEPQAQKRLKAAMALELVAKEDEIEIASEVIEAEMNKTMAQYKNIKNAQENIDMGRLYNYIKGTLQNEEVFSRLEKIA